MKSLLVMIMVAVVAGGTLVVRQLFPAADETTPQERMVYTVARGPLKVTITENGSLLAKDSQKITVRSRRGGKITFLVEEGKSVEEGEVLCRMDTTDLESRLQQLKLDIVKTEADLGSAKTELEIQASENVADIEKAEIALKKAEMELERYTKGDAPKERRTLEIAIKEAETNHSRATKKYTDSEKLLEQEYVTASQVEQDRIAFERSAIQLEGAGRDLEIFETYTFPMTLTDKEAALRDATRNLENAQKRAQSKLRQKEVAVESQDRRLKQLTKQKSDVEEEIANFTITAPTPGIVIYGDPDQYWTRGEIKLGGQIWGGFTLFTIPDLRVMKVQIEVHEADIDKVKPDQVATVTMDTYPGLVLTGKVSKVASIAGSGGGGRREEVKKFTVDIILDDTESRTLKPGISAKAEIFIEGRDSVIFVPLQCVFVEEGEHFCYVQRDAGPVKVAVEAGTSNDMYLEITDGLVTGDQVLLYNPTIQADPSAAQAPGATAEPTPATPDAAETPDVSTAGDGAG
ncbi:MAG: HlyD family efflux transporter periplasmic adaptor subunit [Phycisphaerales bacterium]|nr:efflux RND transporter periplasmic adaptor subunit [Phycisphaerae bacterium]NNF42660.1 HlyD family efflux transporter periplasmic adaptor subunit [Phycisphaerales bacterium]NNM25727.1 HlyD family efflux transporter periplasmic adaptor subunit [Phycisphaerales bacterium]